ncbi:autophagy-related 2 [Oratosquilla oratoria]|uniref:autophagy-related 2 n=1 Tax=Oratosquilla oratoria TaxID=337810 RepID=UPI003F7777C1
MIRRGLETISKMPWYIPIPEDFKKRIVRYLLQRYLGQFVEGKLSLEQLTVNLYNGTGTIRDLTVDVNALNEVADQLNLPIEFVDGYIGEINVTVPWSTLLSENCFVEVSKLMMTVQPKQRAEDISMVDSMIESMTSSMQIAQECLNQMSSEAECKTEGDKGAQTIEGIEHFAHAIDTVLNRIKVRFLETTIRMEHVPKSSQSGVAVEVRVEKVDYFDEAGLDTGVTSNESGKLVYEPAAFATKKLFIEGVSLYTDEFPYESRTFSRSVIIPTPGAGSNCSSDGGEIKNSSSGDSSFKSADTSPTENKEFDYNPEKTMGKIEMCSSLPMEPILFAKLSGRQEIKIKLKQAEIVTSPKFDLEMNFGSLVMFLSPRQIYLLLELAGGISSPDTVDNSNVIRQEHGRQKPMDPKDYQRIEIELQKQLHSQAPVPTHSLNVQQGWSSTPLGDSDDYFVPMGVKSSNTGHDTMYSSQLSGCSDMDGSICSSVAGNTVKSSSVGVSNTPPYRYTGVGVVTPSLSDRNVGTKRKGDQGGRLIDDPSAVMTHFRVKISSLAVVIMHEDVLTPGVENNGRVSKSSIEDMQNKSRDFFRNLGLLSLSGYSAQHFKEIRPKFLEACPVNHLYLVAAPCTLEGSEKSLSNQWEMELCLSVGCAEFIECLVDSAVHPLAAEYSELLVFKDTECEKHATQFLLGAAQPKLKIKISQAHSLSSSKSHHIRIPKLNIKVSLQECASELDLSIVDRISALLNKPDLCLKKNEETFSPDMPPSYMTTQTCFKQAMDDAVLKPETKSCFMLMGTKLTLKLRFPIPDLRPMSDMKRVPWWKRNIRKDVLSFVMKDLEFVTITDPLQSQSSYELRSSDIHVLFTEREGDMPVSLLRACAGKGAEQGFDLPRIFIQIQPEQPLTSLEEEAPVCDNIMTKSMMGFLEEVSETEANPFSRRKVASQQAKESATEELVIPSDKEEIQEFMENTLKNVKMHIQIHLPDVQVVLPSKHIYEVVYNRLVTDLLLWESSAPKPMNRVGQGMTGAVGGGLDIASTFMSESFYQSMAQFSACRSGVGSESESDDDSQFYSVYEHKVRQKQKQQQQQQLHQQSCSGIKRPTVAAVTLSVGHGIASLNTPYRDSKNNVVPGQNGQVMVVVDQGTVFSATGYQGDVNLGYTCIWANQGYIYHRAANTTPDQPPLLDSTCPLSTAHLDAILYPNDVGVVTKLGGGVGQGEDTLDMVTVSIKMDLDEASKMKTIVLAGGVRGATMRHYMSHPSESWFTQLSDMFDVQDYAVEGYEPPDVLTEMNFHLWSCAVDYRPLHLPLCAILTVDGLSISSNLTLASNTSVVRFLIEDAELFLSDRVNARSVDLRKNYVAIADLGYFELCLRQVDDKTHSQPKIDLCASNNVIHIRTCADSCKALMELLIYMASDGDLTQEAESVPEVPEDSATPSEPEEGFFTPPYRESTVHQHEMVQNMMQDAMEESSSSSSYEDQDDPAHYMQKGVEVFFFPNENKVKTQIEPPKTMTVQDETQMDTRSMLEEAQQEPSEQPHDDNHSSTDEDFCILDDAPGTGIRSPSGEPQVKILTNEPVVVQDNHFFVPLSKFDQLRAPKHFPKPSFRYTLNELTLVWHMYGGSDFRKASEGNGKKRRVTINENNVTTELSRSPKPEHVIFTQQTADGHFHVGYKTANMPETPPHSPGQQAKTSWQVMGGLNRRHDVLMELQLSKVRFQHEVYPADKKQASRFVLLVHDVEIRDRLSTSKINKFLYQYSSESCPRQAHANMFQIKAMTEWDDTRKRKETSMKISMRPVRLHIDQDALLFLSQFFEELLSADRESDVGEEEFPQTFQSVDPPIMTVNLNQSAQLTSVSDQQLLVNIEEKLSPTSSEELISTTQENAPIYFKSFIFSPDVSIKIDYHGKHIDINSQYGPLAGLLIGLGQLNNSELTLKSVVLKSGLLGVDKLISFIIGEWLKDIKSNQLPSLLGGVGPVHSFVQLFSGLRDLVWMPIEQYQKDGRVVRGLQRGASAFTTSSAHAALDLTSRFVGCIQTTAEMLFDMVSPGPSVRMRRKHQIAGHPQDIRDGLVGAMDIVVEGFSSTASNITKAAIEEHHHKGFSGAVGAVLREIPPTMVQPLITIPQATTTLIGGVKNQLHPDARKESYDKWKP